MRVLSCCSKLVIMTAFAFVLSALMIRHESYGAQKCYDLSKGEPRTLDGMLDYKIFAGPPNYEDVQKGDTPEPSHVLKVANPICLSGDDYANPSLEFDEVQLVADEGVGVAMRSLVGSMVTVTLHDQMGAQTGHHHRPLVAWVSDIKRINDTLAEYGTAATTVRAFYYALAVGNGHVAATFVIPEKRKSAAFSPSKMSEFYGALVEPLTLLSLQLRQDGLVEAEYRYRSHSGACNGRALVRTEKRDGRYFILSIKALSGC